jgi:hypothetical protein
MRKWTLAMGLSVLGAAGWAAADDEKARVREGHEAHADHATAAADRHPSPHADSAPAAAPHSAPADSYAPASADPVRDAQLRHPRPGTGTGDRDRRFGRSGGRIIYGGRGYYYDPFFYGGYYGYYPYYGYGGYYGGYPYGYGYGYGYAYRPYSRSYRDNGSVRILVDPNKTRVYVDGYYAGIADDFDGIFQRLNLAPGRHEITLRLEGFRTQRFRVYVPYDHTIKIHHRMVPGEGEEAAEEILGEPGGYVAEGRRGGYEPDDRTSADAGQLRLDVRPSDASIYVDGEFRGTARDHDRLTLPPGRHRIEVVRPGFRTLEREVDIRPGRTSDLEVELIR